MDVRFAIAARHSRLVRILRIAVPLTVALAMAAIIGISVFNPFRYLAKLPLDIGDLVVSGSKITMESPHLSGFSPDGRPYELWARTATQDLTRPDVVDLHTLRAKMVMEDQSTVIMDARDGRFDTKAQLLNLQKDIYLRTSAGNEIWMTQADVDIGKGNVASDEPVDVNWLGGKLRGQRMRITDKGELIRFEGGVVMNLDSAGATTPAQPAIEPKTEPGSGKARSPSGNRANAK
jgi:lipopolysaccharide export system protein LptC